MAENYFSELNSINVNDLTEQKNGLDYLPWAIAWAETKKVHPDATYNIKKFGEAQLPYVYDENTGYMVYTDVTIGGITHEMWLPVMDGSNKAMKACEYTYKVKNQSFKYAKLNPQDGKYYDKYNNEQREYNVKTVEAATMFDINKTIMRCLTKNLAMHGLGLYIYAGEDLPESQDDETPAPPTPQQKDDSQVPITQAERQMLFSKARELFGSEGNNVVKKVLGDFGIESTSGMKKGTYIQVLDAISKYQPQATA